MDVSVSSASEDQAENIACVIETLSLLNPCKQVADDLSAVKEPSSVEEAATRMKVYGRDCSSSSSSQRKQLGLPRLSGHWSRDRACSSDKQEGTTASKFVDDEKKDVEMDAKLWSELPEHLMDIILACLPVPSFLRLRAVCKKWNTLLHSSSFKQVCGRARTRVPFFLMYADHVRQRYAAYNPALGVWHLLPHSCFMSGNCLIPFVVLAAAGGLICLGGASGPQGRNLYVSNPMTKARKQLPPMLRMPNPYIVGMVIEGNSYKILVGQEGEQLKLQVFDSTSGQWEMTGSLYKRVALVVGNAYLQGILYCLTFGPGIGVSTYHVGQGTWQELRAPLPAALTWPQLFESRKKLMLVGGVEEYGGIMNSIYVWELDPMRMAWVEVLRMPDDLMLELSRGPPGGRFLFVADGDYICFTYYRGKEMLMCNLLRKSWWWLPRCTLDEYFDARSVLGFSLQPRLDQAV